MLQFYSDEAYETGAFAVRENWYPFLDQLGKYLNQEYKNGILVKINGYADLNSPQEKTPSDYGSSDLTFSYARAEWVARYFERKFGIPIRTVCMLTGMGAVQNGKKVELIFYY